MSSTAAQIAQLPPSVRDILSIYSEKSSEIDREILLAVLQAKAAEDQRITAIAVLQQQYYALQRYVAEVARTSSKATSTTSHDRSESSSSSLETLSIASSLADVTQSPTVVTPGETAKTSASSAASCPSRKRKAEEYGSEHAKPVRRRTASPLTESNASSMRKSGTSAFEQSGSEVRGKLAETPSESVVEGIQAKDIVTEATEVSPAAEISPLLYGRLRPVEDPPVSSDASAQLRRSVYALH